MTDSITLLLKFLCGQTLAKDQALKAQIEVLHRQHPAYGHSRVALHLGINHKWAQHVMTHYNLRPPRRPAKSYTMVATLYPTKSQSLMPLEDI